MLIILLLLVLQKSYALHQEELFLRGNKYAYDHEWESALHEYSEIEKKSAAVLYNMGICYEQLGQLDRAQLYWLKALSTAGQNLYARIDEKLDRFAHRSLFVRYAGWIAAGWSLLFVQFLCIILWYGIFGFLFFRKKNKVLLIFLTLLLLVALCCLYSKVVDRRVIGFIKKQDAPLFVGPNEQYAVIGLPVFGTSVTINEKRNGWYRITTQLGNGWIPKESVESLE